MAKLLSSNPEIFYSLRTDLQNILDRRLRDLGVDPEWTALPDKTFKCKIDVLKHHMKIAAKVFCGFFLEFIVTFLILISYLIY